MVVHVPHAAPRQTGSDPQASAASLPPANHQAALRPSAAGRHRPLGAQVAHCGEMRSPSLADHVAAPPSAESQQLLIRSVTEDDDSAAMCCKRPFVWKVFALYSGVCQVLCVSCGRGLYLSSQWGRRGSIQIEKRKKKKAIRTQVEVNWRLCCRAPVATKDVTVTSSDCNIHHQRLMNSIRKKSFK